jgi:RND family efflux transporter MFP subunit
MMLRFLCTVASALALACVLSGCGEGASSEPDVSASPALVLEFAAVVEREFREPILGTGTIAPQKTTNIGPRVDGMIEEIFVNVGDRVEAGRPLFRTRPDDYEIRVAAAKADLRLARAEAAKAGSDLERIRALWGKMVVSAEQREGAEMRRKIGLARVEAAGAALAKAQHDLADTVVPAPYDGVITRRVVDEGAMMRTMMSSGSPVVQIMKTDWVVAIVFVPELYLPRIAIGTPARIHIDGLNREVESTVYVINDLVDPATHTMEVRLAIENPDLEVKPGLFVKAEFDPAPRTLKLLDRRAVLGFGDERYVFVEQEGRAIRRTIRVRDLDALHVEVLEGVTAGDRVLMGSDLARLTDGAPVRVRAAADGASRVAL